MPYSTVKGVPNVTVISTTSGVTIGTVGTVRLHVVNVTAALTGTCTIAGFQDEAGNAQTITLPTTATSHLFYGAYNTIGSLVVTCSNAADDNKVFVVWEPSQ